MNTTDHSQFFTSVRLRFKSQILESRKSYHAAKRTLNVNAKGNLKPDSIRQEVAHCIQNLQLKELLAILVLWHRCLSDFGLQARQHELLERDLLRIFWKTLKTISTEDEVAFTYYLWTSQVGRRQENPMCGAIETVLLGLATLDDRYEKGNTARKILSSALTFSGTGRKELKSRALKGYRRIKKLLAFRPKIVRADLPEFKRHTRPSSGMLRQTGT